MRWRGIVGVVLVGGAAAVAFGGLKLHRRPQHIRHFEAREYGGEGWIEPVSAEDGLAVYAVGTGEPVLLFPYPHGSTVEPMAESPLAGILVEMGRRVITFDVPGAYRSTREPTGEMAEIVQAADEALARLGIDGPVDVAGHSMGGFTALAYAVERPERVRRLALVGAVPGFPSAARSGLPRSRFRITEPDYWRVVLWGMQVGSGRASLETHKRLQNLMTEASTYNTATFSPVEIDADDAEQGVPVRMIWVKNMYRRLSYADRLGEVRAPTLVAVGRHDAMAPLPCSEAIAAGIEGAELVIFEASGHYPFNEEPEPFARSLDAFLIGSADAAAR